MARTVDREVLVGFVEEARGYLPVILRDIEVCRADPTRLDALEEAHRHAHTIKGAAAMVGLAGLSHIAFHVEEALEEIAAGQLPLDDPAVAVLRQTVTQMDGYLDGVLRGDLRERPLVAEVTLAFRRLRGLPETEDQAAVPEALADVGAGEPGSRGAGEQGSRGAEEPISSAPPPLRSSAPPPLRSSALLPEEATPELLEAFALEAEDHLRHVSALLADLDRQPDEAGQKALLQDIRRSVHTLKGAAGALGFRTAVQLAHRMEDLLDLLYDGAQAVTPEVLALLFASTDALEDLVGGEFDPAAMPGALQDLYARYAAWLGQAAPQAAEARPARRVEPLGAAPVIDLAELVPRLAEAVETEVVEKPAPAAPRAPAHVVRVPIERLDELVRLVSELAINRTAFEQRMTDFARFMEDLRFSAERLRRAATNLETQYEASTLGGVGQAVSLPGSTPGGAAAQANSLRYNTHDFDALEFDRYTEFHRLARELTETTSDIRTVANELTTLIGDFDSALNRQARISSELQDKLMRVRMVPLAALATRLHRTVRTVAQDQGKLVDLVLEGEHIELDKTMLEEMVDPLLHLLRNAVGHGIEPPALRQVLGKPERGQVRLRAYHEGNQVVIQVRDDGAGLEPQLLRAAAVSGGYVSEANAPQLADEELYSLIFLPGFSTAGEVNQVAGRGVGLDVVKTNVHRLQGTVTVDSTPGQGATFTIRLPMTLAVMRALLVRAHGETFAIPQGAVAQILRLEPGQVEHVGQEPVVRVGQRVYPVLRLGDALRLKQPADESVQRPPALILNAGSKQAALIVDRLLTGREIVVKTLGNHLRRVHGVTGATLMGDGSVVLILNPVDLMSAPAQPAPLPWVAPQKARQAWNVMVVDDSVSVRRVVSNLIRAAGWQPVVAKDGVEALEIMQRSARPPDLILLDIEMPRMDGYELMAALKGQEAYRNVPIVILTSRAGEKHRRKALDLGASEYVVKPYQDEALLGLIRRLIHK